MLALLGLIALVIVVRRRQDRRAPGLFVLGGWFLVELLTLDFSSGIVHPYYASALGPGLAVMVGAGAVALATLVRSPSNRTALLGYVLSVLAIGGTVGVQLFLIGRYSDPTWWRIPLVVIAIAAVVAIPLLRARAGTALAIAVAAVLVAPMVYSFSVWLAPVDGTFPTAGPYDHAGYGGYGRSRLGLRATRSLIRFLARARRDQALRAADRVLRPGVELHPARPERRCRGRLQHDRSGARQRAPRVPRRPPRGPLLPDRRPLRRARRQRRLQCGAAGLPGGPGARVGERRIDRRIVAGGLCGTISGAPPPRSLGAPVPARTPARALHALSGGALHTR